MDQSTWVEITTALAAAPYPVEALPVDSERAASCLAALGITTRSWLKAVVANSGGLVIDHGWLRVLSRKPIRLTELIAVHQDLARRLGFL